MVLEPKASVDSVANDGDWQRTRRETLHGRLIVVAHYPTATGRLP